MFPFAELVDETRERTLTGHVQSEFTFLCKSSMLVFKNGLLCLDEGHKRFFDSNFHSLTHDGIDREEVEDIFSVVLADICPS